MLNALAVLLVFQLVGEVSVQWLRLPLPGPVVGMLLLFAALVLRGDVPEGLRESASNLLQHLMLLFIPAVAGVMIHFERVGREWLPFLLAALGGTAVTLVVTAFTLRLLLARAKADSQ
jgi:holin-like protein